MNWQSHIPDRLSGLMEPDEAADIVETPPESWFVTALGIGAGVVMRRTLRAVWAKGLGAEPPNDPSDSEVSWKDALIWTASVGAAVGVARVLSRRGTTAAVRRFYS